MNSIQIVKKVDKKLGEIIHEDLPILKQIKKFVIKSGGKRIRPITHYYFTKMLGYSGNEWVDVGAIGELIHAASLLHDDVVDTAVLRRGKSTVNALHGNKTAVLSGDYLLSCALDHLQTLKDHKEMTLIFTRVVRMLSVGELLQMQWETEFSTEDRIYDRIILGKTGSLFGAMVESSAVLGGLDREMIPGYRAFGEKMGRVFQIRDDFLDYFGTAEKDGKDPYQDFRRGVITKPVILLRDKAKAGDKRKLKALWSSDEKRNSSEGEALVRSLFDQYKIRRILAREIETGIHDLMLFLRKHPASTQRERIMEHLEKLLVSPD